MRNVCAFVFALVGSIAVVSGQLRAASVFRSADAARIFERAHALCEADAGALWGVSLCVPMMIVDPNTRLAFTNVAAPGARHDGALFRLTLPPNVQISTAPFTYHGMRWAQLTWPLFGSPRTQVVTLMHESFHVVQPRLGFNGNADNGSISGDAELDTQTGRIWLRGELHALRAALHSTGAARKYALRDAISMRLYREARLPGTAQSERNLDLLEGLAESTGIDVALPAKQRVAYAIFDTTFVESQPSYARAFPYATGPAYSELLDAMRPRWRRLLTPSSAIARMAMRAYGLNVATPSAGRAQAIIGQYGGAAIEAQEVELAAHKVALAKKYTSELVNGATLQLPMRNFSITFNPRDIETLAPYGSVYHTLAVTAPWGAITVSNGDAMISKGFRFLRVAAPSKVHGTVVQGRGWTLKRAAGYTIVPDPKKTGSYMISAQH